MLGHLGFSYVGLAYLVMLFTPNILWARPLPAGYDSAGERRALVALERIGQVGCTACALCFADFNLKPLSPWSAWLGVSFALMLLYEAAWIRYFRGPRTVARFYAPLWGIPLPLATLPVAAFLLLGIYGRVIWMIIASVVLGVGHIGIHAGHARALKKDT